MTIEKKKLADVRPTLSDVCHDRHAAWHWLNTERERRTVAIAHLATVLNLQLPRELAEAADSTVLNWVVNHLRGRSEAAPRTDTLQCLRNIGADTSCGACMCKAFTGRDATYPHTCTPTQARNDASFAAGRAAALKDLRIALGVDK